jgi:hypothetical protein
MTRWKKTAILMGCATMMAGCSQGSWPGHSRFQVDSPTLVGRWSGVPKDVADGFPDAQEVKGPAGEIARFRWEFKNDQTYKTSVEAKVGNTSQLDRRGSVKGTWRVVEIRGNTLTIELPVQDLRPRVKVVFESKDRCLLDQGDGEVFVLTRLP